MMRRVTVPARTGASLRSAGLRGVAFIYFALLALPAFFVGAGMATDFTRIIIANREVSNAAQAAALSGAQEFKQDSPDLDERLARAAAIKTYCIAQGNGVTSMAEGVGPTVACPAETGDQVPIEVTLGDQYNKAGQQVHTSVSVTAHYRVHSLIFTNFFGLGDSVKTAPITRTAQVCFSDDGDGPTNGFCTHPDR